MSLIAKLKRRNVFRSALAYAVAAWLLVEVMELVTETFGAPDWVLQVFVSLAVIGIVPVVLFSWMYEITPEGIKRESEGGIDHSVATTHRLNVAIIIMLAVAIGLFGYEQFASQEDASRTAGPATAEGRSSSPATDKTPPSAPGHVEDPGAPPMVAVLPFTTVSLDGESDFFAVGIHDDLLTQLAKMESMRVISRTSVLDYKDTRKNIRDIGQELGADIIMEGGIQTAGGRIRINAQLIDAGTDEHLWAETYDRELSTHNIFDVQRDIAGAIANALNTTLTVQDDKQLRELPTENMAAYRAYHRALDIWNDRRRYNDWTTEYADALREAIALDPNYVRPRAELVGVIALDAVGMVVTDPDIAAAAEVELEAIRRIAPESAEFLIAQTYYIYYVLRDYEHAYEVVNQTLARNPSDIRVLHLKGYIERRLQDWDARMETLREIVRLDPRNGDQKGILIHNLAIVHRYDELEDSLEEAPPGDLLLDGYRHLMTFRADRDFARFLQNMQMLYRQMPNVYFTAMLDVLILNGRFAEAATLFAGVEPEKAPMNTNHYLGWQLLISWLLEDEEALESAIGDAETFLDQRRDADGNIRDISDYLLVAKIAAVKGQRETTIRAVKDWELLVVEDPAQIPPDGPTTCMVLGVVEATKLAADCLRRYLVEPSYAMPFLTPYGPYFDSIRDEPEFAALMADIEAGRYD
jgi:TolB-like protein